MSVTAILFALATVVITLIGGTIALKLKKFINPLIAFCGGTLISLALLDLIPESLELLEEHEPFVVLSIALGTFILVHLLDKLFLIHGHSHSEDCAESHSRLGMSSIIGYMAHSFLDGMIIGTGFLVDTSTGILVSTIVLLHRLADGINTITLSLRNKHQEKSARIVLFFNSISPLLGVLASQLIQPSQSMLGFTLAAFAGFFLYLGATDLLPEAHKERSSVRLVLFTIGGVVLVALIKLASGH